MKNGKRCCFARHSDIWENNLPEKIKTAAENLIVNHNVKEFWVGNYGKFDNIAFCAIRELQKVYSDIELDLVIPYLTKDINKNSELYHKKCDNILIADIPQNTPKRFYIKKANEYIVDNSHFLICCIQTSWGGAINTYKYAKRKKLQIFNIAGKTTNE